MSLFVVRARNPQIPGFRKISAMGETCGTDPVSAYPQRRFKMAPAMRTHADSTLARKELADNATNISSYVKHLTDSGCGLRLRTLRRRLQSGPSAHCAALRRREAPCAKSATHSSHIKLAALIKGCAVV
jgi:hypothetical protein